MALATNVFHVDYGVGIHASACEATLAFVGP